MKKMVKDVLQGENRLLYTYGVTNSGKTYTIQGRIFRCESVQAAPCIFNHKHCSPGSEQEAGLLPRALVSLFRKLQGRLYAPMDVKPVMYQDVRQLDAGEVRAEEIQRTSLLQEVNKVMFLKLICCIQVSVITKSFMYSFNMTQNHKGVFLQADLF